MEDVKYASIYELVTKLCQKFATQGGKKASKQCVQKLRSKCYEILLSKKTPQTEIGFLENNTDPICNLLAWQFILINQYHLSEQAEKIQKCVEMLQKSLPANDSVLKGILFILFQLRQPPDLDSSISVSSFGTRDSFLKFRCFDQSSFSLNVPIICTDSKFKNASFYLKPKPRQQIYRYSANDVCKACLRIPSRISCDFFYPSKIADGYESPSEEFDIWEMVSNTIFTEHRTWETLGNSTPKKEHPFITEATSSVCSDLYDLLKPNMTGFVNGGIHIVPTKLLPQSTFIKHIKFLLVGMTSDSFQLDSNDELQLVTGVSVEGITINAMESYCRDLIFCGSCYGALNNLCNMGIQSYGNQHKGFIFKEFCESIKRYLSYYRVATLSMSESTNLLSVHNHVRPLYYHLDCLASICKVGPCTKSEELPSGVALLNYLYQKLISLTRKDVIMVLYSILYPCIQVYFSRFLQQWIFEGIVNDPYNEFFIRNSQNLMNSRSRCYWSRCFSVQEDVVPDFLTELSQDILYCGKAMNLLKLCAPNSSLCIYLMGKKPTLLSCCLNSDQTSTLEQKATCYYLEVTAECGPKFSVEDLLAKNYEQRIIFMNLITKKRAATLRRLEMEKLKKAQDDLERKQESMATLKAQYDKALQDKKSQMIKDIVRDMKTNEALLRVHTLRRKLIEEEAIKIIGYYNSLSEISEHKRQSIERHIEKLKKIDLDISPLAEIPVLRTVNSESRCQSALQQPKQAIDDVESMDKSSSEISFLSANSDSARDEDYQPSADVPPENATPCICLDTLNANSETQLCSDLAKATLENNEAAKRNKAKVMTEELGFECREINKGEESKKILDNENLTELQRNRLKVLSSEFCIDVNINGKATKEKLTICEINKRKNMASNACFYQKEIKVDNENYVNKNIIFDDNTKNVIDKTKKIKVEENGNKISILIENDVSNKNKTVEDTETKVSKIDHKNYNNLKLDLSKVQTQPNFSIFSKFLKSPNFELDKPTPMSIDSTPCTDISFSLEKDDKSYYSQSASISMPTTARTTTCYDEESFHFIKDFTKSTILDNSLTKRVSIDDAKNVSTDCLKLFIQQSVSIPVITQTKLVNNELLKFFFTDLQYLSHLNSLRNYFFLLDGEFGRNITERLFEKLYDVNFPVDLINCRTLQHLVYNAKDSSIKFQENSNCLSFRINNLPKTFDLGNPDVLDCLSLSYKVQWPLNILLPPDTISKYDEVFKFLLKLNRVSWVLKKIFQELKLLSKNSKKREAFLILSPQFNRLHQCRHVMTHFVQTLQNYVVGEVLQPSWDTFEKKIISTDNLNELYTLHTSYIKNILFMCLLNKRFTPVRRVIQNIFVVILKFYNYISVKHWEFVEEDGVFTHPNFKKLDDIFTNFEEFVIYLFKAGQKVAKVGYHPHLVQLLDMLNINGYYSRKSDSQSVNLSV